MHAWHGMSTLRPLEGLLAMRGLTAATSSRRRLLNQRRLDAIKLDDVALSGNFPAPALSRHCAASLFLTLRAILKCIVKDLIETL